MNRPGFLLWPLQMVLPCGSFKMFLESPYFWEIQNSTINSLKIVPMCNCIHLPVTEKLLETFLEGILWKPIQPFRCIRNYVSSITKHHPFSADFCQGSLRHFRRLWQMFQCCHIIFKEIRDRNWLVCWSIVVKEKPTVLHFWDSFFFLSFFLSSFSFFFFLLTPSPRWQRMLLTFIIPQVLCQQILRKLYLQIPGTSWRCCVLRAFCWIKHSI